MSKIRKRLFCFGYGYTADYLGHELQTNHEGWTIGGTTRDPERRQELLLRRIRARVFDYEHPIADPRTLFSRFSHLLISTPPDDRGDPVYNMHAEELINLPNLKWVGYLSSTGVYGNRNGASVDETAEVTPTSQRGSRRALAEQQWYSLFEKHNVPVHIFRLSGIYGPGRSALDTMRAGIARRVDKPGHVFNRIHVDDIVQTIIASFKNPNPGQVYNLADDIPAPSHEVIAEACALLNMPAPPLIHHDEVDLSPIAQSFYKDNKHVLNDKIKRELGIELKYSNYRDGLKGCLAAEQNFIDQQEKIII